MIQCFHPDKNKVTAMRAAIPPPIPSITADFNPHPHMLPTGIVSDVHPMQLPTNPQKSVNALKFNWLIYHILNLM